MKNTLFLTIIAMIAFAGNSILTRMALQTEVIEPFSFTLLRLCSGAVILAIVASPRRAFASGSWASAAALLCYAGFFSYAYLSLATGTGALILFAIVQITMIGTGLFKGERLSILQWLGTILALCGLFYLLIPGATAPAPLGGAIMMLAGIGWGIYSLRGRGGGNPTQDTAGNFLKASALAAILSIPIFMILPEQKPEPVGIALALASGIITSGAGYAIWYKALKNLSATTAGIAQLTVPAIAALGGILFLSEPLTFRFAVASIVILSGVAIATLLKPRTKS